VHLSRQIQASKTYTRVIPRRMHIAQVLWCEISHIIDPHIIIPGWRRINRPAAAHGEVEHYVPLDRRIADELTLGEAAEQYVVKVR
jgi:hypothetical protein